MTKYMRKIQFRDKKFRTIQAISDLVNSSSVKISVRFVNYSGLFINFIINKIITDAEQHMVSISYVLRIRDYQFISYWKLNPEIIIKISEINIPGKFDENILPELDNLIKNPYTYSEGDIYDKFINKKIVLHNWDGNIQRDMRIIRNDKIHNCLVLINTNKNGVLSNDEHILKYNLIGNNAAVTKIELLEI